MSWRDYIPRVRIGPEPQQPTDTDLRAVHRADAGDIFRARNIGLTGNTWADIEHAKYYATSTPAYAAVKLRADSVASASLTILREVGGELEPVGPQHPVQEMFDRVNPWWTHADLWKATETHLSLFGSAFWFVDVDGESGPEIWPVRADRMRIVPERKRNGRAEMPNAYIAGFEYEANGARIPLTTEEVIWFRYFNPMDEYAGLSPVAPARLTLDMGKDAVQYNRNFFSEGVHPGNLAFSSPDTFTDDQVEDFYRRLDMRFRGAKKSHRPWLLTNGLEAKNIGMTQKDMEFLSSLQYTVEDAARVWRVWPELLASGTRAAFRNVPEAAADFWLSTVSNEWAFLETEVTELLMPVLGRQAEGLVAAFDTSEVHALEEARIESNRGNLEGVKLGAMTINEWRERQGMDPVPWGDVYWAPNGLFPVSDAASTPFSLSLPPVGEESMRIGVQHKSISMPRRLMLPAPSHRGQFKQSETEKALVMENILGVWEKAFRRREVSFRSMQRGLFGDQQEDVERFIRRSGVDVVDELANVIDIEKTVDKWSKRAQPLYEDAVSVAARTLAMQWNLKPLQTALDQERIFNPLNPSDPGFKVWVAERMRVWATSANETTRNLLMQEISAALDAGEGIPDVMARVEKVFNFSNEVRAERIARTEILSASNRGNFEMMQASGVVEQKRWLTANDERVRDTHLDVQRRGAIPLDEDFTVGGDRMSAPGQGSLGSENINCRCVVQPVITRD